jgi:hypothetical protein
MTQQILMILPSTEDEAPRLVGPFLTEATANAWADTEKIDPIRRVVRPLESPSSIYGYGRHALIPSPVPRNVEAGALAAWEEKKAAARKRSGGGISGVLEGIYGPPPPFPDMPTRRLAEDNGVLWQREEGGDWKPVAETTNPTLRVDAEREPPPPGAPPLTGGIRHWITGEAMESAPRNVVEHAEAIGHWSGPVARFNYSTTDGRVLQLSGTDVGDWLPHFVRVPVGVWVIMPDFGPLPIGLCERVRVEDGWLMGEGRVSLAHFEKAAPELYRGATTPLMESIPAAIDVTGGQRGYSAGEHIISGQWELERVVFGSTPAWPGCRVQLDGMELEPRRG